MTTFADPQTGATGNNPGANYGKQNVMTKVKLSPFEERELARGAANPYYIYNVSMIHEWPRYQGQFGTVMIQKAPWNFEGPLIERVSAPYIVPGAVCRTYDAGDRKQKPFIEGGLEVVEDIIQCSEKYPPQDANSNLTNYGVFFTSESFGKLKAKEQESHFDAAFAKFEVKCRKLVQVADQLQAGDPKQRAFIMPIHLDALKVISELDGEELKRDWAPTSSGKKYKTCQFCGTRNTPASVMCVNCKEITDKAGYEKLKGGK